MPKNNVYVVFAPRSIRGVYDSWVRCQSALRGVSGTSFAGFKNVAEANEALRCGSLAEYRARAATRKPWIGHVQLPCIVVDAACSGAPGPVEYRGVVIPEMYEAFRRGPYHQGTNNIGEFLAIVAGLRWLENTSLDFPLYSDSAVAIGWVTGRGECNTHQVPGAELRDAIAAAERWLMLPSSRALAESRVRKWDTRELGEIPADYGRK